MAKIEYKVDHYIPFVSLMGRRVLKSALIISTSFFLYLSACNRCSTDDCKIEQALTDTLKVYFSCQEHKKEVPFLSKRKYFEDVRNDTYALSVCDKLNSKELKLLKKGTDNLEVRLINQKILDEFPGYTSVSVSFRVLNFNPWEIVSHKSKPIEESIKESKSKSIGGSAKLTNYEEQEGWAITKISVPSLTIE